MKHTKINTDILVVGGGMAGVVAAVTAARQGAQVVLIEKSGYLGGTATSSMLGEMNAFTNLGQKLYGGVTDEIVNTMVAQGFAQFRYKVPMTGNPSILVDRVGYDPEQFKFFLDDFLTKENVSLFLHSTFSDIERTSDTTYRVFATNYYEQLDIQCSLIIDATGNAEVVFRQRNNLQTWKPAESQSVSLIFRMGGINTSLYKQFSIDKLRQVILTGYEQGFLPAKYCAINIVNGTNDAIINMTRISGIDHESILDITRAELEGRKQIQHAVPYIKQSLPGFGSAYITAIAPMPGIRDARRIKGVYTLCQKDILSGTKFSDAVAIGCYPIDIHGKAHTVDFTPIGGDGVYTIPYGCLLPLSAERIIAAGKCISVDEGAFAAIRTMPTVMCIGEAAGTAAALSCKHRVAPDKLSTQEIRSILNNHGYKFSI